MPHDKIDLGDDEGYVTIGVCGVDLELCPNEELDAIHERAKSLGTTTFVQFLREYIAEKTKAKGSEKRVSSAYATRFYNTLVAEEKRVTDFFGLARSSGSTSDSSLADGQLEKSEAGSPTSPDSSVNSPSETSTT
jgi:hypothetical protein